MRSPLARLALLLFLLAMVGGRVRAQTLQFADGQVLLVNIDEVDGNGLRVHRLDNGGQLELRWEHLSPDCALRIKQAYALIGSAEEEATVAADLVTYEKDGIKQEVLGKIDDAAGTPTELVVRKKGVQFRVAKAELKGVKKVQAPVGQVYTRDEYYAELLTAQAPGDQADKHVNLAQDLIKVRDYDHASDHLNKAKELGNTRDPNRLQQLTEKLARYKDSAKERLLLDQIQFARQRGNGPEFELGLKLIAQYEKEYPASKLKAEFEVEKKRFAEARTRFLAQQVAEKWRQLIQAVADKKAGETGVTLASAREYATGKMKDDIAARVAEQAKLPLDEVKALFADRAKYPIGKRPEFFAYGIGSWTLGDKGILKDTKQGQAQASKTDKDPAQEREIERLAKLIRQAMERRRAAAQNQQGGAQESTDEDWWREATRNEKTSFVRAYYAEFGGEMKVTIAYLQPCIACYGEGTVTELGSEQKVQKVKCYLCHGSKWLRSFRAY